MEFVLIGLDNWVVKLGLLFCCFLSAFPFFIIGYYGKQKEDEPVAFWANGENNLKPIVKDLKGYNQEMGKLYEDTALTFMILGLISLIIPLVTLIGIVFACTAGIFVLYIIYKKILKKYS
ncbi:MAG: hypothetical protein J1E40_02470 [Oscillospiraceae bacterium]|nr:hypothetical protein [Oscillospiraceae bacterium]